LFLRKEYIFYGAAVIGLIAVASVFISSRWSGQITEAYTFPTGYGQEAIIVTCSTDEDSSLLDEVAFEAFEAFETGVGSIAKSSAQKMQEAMQFANANGSLPDFSKIEAEGLEMRRELLDEIKERYECVISRLAT